MASCQPLRSIRSGSNIGIVAGALTTSSTSASGQAIGLTSRRTVKEMPIIAIDSGSSGAMPQASRSAQKLLVNSRKNRISPAIGRSTTRVQWMSNPAGGFIRYWRRSYQPCPSSSARTCISRILSSVSPSASQ